MSETSDPATVSQLRRQVSELTRGYRAAQVLLTCVELGVFEAIIEAVITASALPPGIQARALRIFRRMIAVEAGIHNAAIESVHLHELGALDTIVDVAGGLLGLEQPDHHPGQRLPVAHIEPLAVLAQHLNQGIIQARRVFHAHSPKLSASKSIAHLAQCGRHALPSFVSQSGFMSD